MKKFLSVILAVLMLASMLAVTSCAGESGSSGNTEGSTSGGTTETPETPQPRAFVAGYEQSVTEGDTTVTKSGRVLMNLALDGTMDIYVGLIDADVHSTAHYTGTYTFGENADFDETISMTYTYAEGQTAEIKDAVIVDGIFEAPFYMVSSMTANDIKFYETAPADLDGDVYVGYLTKTGGMGAMVYAYALCLKEDGTFAVSIMQMASVMHVWGATGGNYVENGESITFTYDVLSDEGEIVTEDYVSEGTGYTETALSVGFNISQTSARASDASFVRVK